MRVRLLVKLINQSILDLVNPKIWHQLLPYIWRHNPTNLKSLRCFLTSECNLYRWQSCDWVVLLQDSNWHGMHNTDHEWLKTAWLKCNKFTCWRYKHWCKLQRAWIRSGKVDARDTLWRSDSIWWSGEPLVQITALSPDGTKPLFEPMSKNHRWRLVAFAWVQFDRKGLGRGKISILNMILKIIDLRSQPHLQGASEFMFAVGQGLAKMWDVFTSQLRWPSMVGHKVSYIDIL